MPRPQYHGKDFFHRPQFRGLFLSDHQEAIGEEAFRCVDSLNAETVSKFNDIESFREEITAKKIQQAYYQENTKVKSFIKKGGSIQLSGQSKPMTSLTGQRVHSKQRSVAGAEETDTLWSMRHGSKDADDRRLHTT